MSNSYDPDNPPRSGWGEDHKHRARDLDQHPDAPRDLAAALKYDVLESGADFERKLRILSDFYANSANFVATLTAQIKDSK